MQVPLEIHTRHLPRHLLDRAEALVREHVAKLEHLAQDIVSCRVAVEEAQPPPHRSANPYRVRIRLTLAPGKELVVVRDIGDSEADDPLELVIRHAFEAMRRRLTSLRQRRRGEVKHRGEPLAIVIRMFPQERYGFLKSLDDGHEIYLHENAVAGGAFERLAIGTVVRYEETRGAKGPQASTVQIVEKPGSRTPVRGPVSQHAPRGWKRFETD